jgi:hypothetical protein
VSDKIKQVALGFLFWIAFSIPVLLAIITLPFFILAFACGAENLRPWVYRVGKALDQTSNAALFGGNPKETVSSHAGRWIVSGRNMPAWVPVVDRATGIFEDDHCVKAIEEPFLGESL